MLAAITAVRIRPSIMLKEGTIYAYLSVCSDGPVRVSVLRHLRQRVVNPARVRGENFALVQMRVEKYLRRSKTVMVGFVDLIYYAMICIRVRRVDLLDRFTRVS